MEQLRLSTFDVLLTDIQMPAINGFDLVRLLRASNIQQARTIPVIAVTARSEMNKVTLREHGFAGCLHKPFTIRELLITVNDGQMSADEAHIDNIRLIENRGFVEKVNDSIADNNYSAFNFSALTAFSEDDPEAAHSIILTFVEETSKNVERMQQALNDREVDEIAAMSHKLLPLFMLIGASEAISFLEWLEGQRGQNFSERIREKTDCVLQEILRILEEARKYEQYL